MINILLSLLAAYFTLGALFAGWFCAVGVRRIDPHARDGSRGFRLAIFPGVTALWPLLLARVLRGGEHPPVERTPHRLAARHNASAS